MLEERNCFEDPGTGERIILKKSRLWQLWELYLYGTWQGTAVGFC